MAYVELSFEKLSTGSLLIVIELFPHLRSVLCLLETTLDDPANLNRISAVLNWRSYPTCQASFSAVQGPYRVTVECVLDDWRSSTEYFNLQSCFRRLNVSCRETSSWRSTTI